MSLTLGILWLPEERIKTINDGTISFQRRETQYETLPALLFSYGITDNLTWENFLSLRHGLYSSGRNDLALSIGTAEGGLGYEKATGFYIAPGIALLHSLDFGYGFRLTSRASMSGRYQSKKDGDDANFSFDAIRLGSTFSKTFANTFTLSAGASSYAGYQRQVLDRQIEKNWKWHLVTADPTFSASLALGSKAELSMTMVLDHASLNRSGGPTSFQSLETRF